MDDLLDVADFAFTGFIADQTARYATADGRRALESERRITLSPSELAWQRMVEATQRSIRERQAADALDVDRIVRDRMLIDIDADYARMAQFRAALNNERHAA